MNESKYFKKIETECGYCNKKFKLKPSVFIKTNIHFCSCECFNNSRKKRIKFLCKNCGKKVIRKASCVIHYKNNFCSQKCNYEWKRKYGEIRVKCNTCGKILIINPYKEKHNKTHFCNAKCMGIWRTKKIYVKCDLCNKKINKSAYVISKNKNHFCDGKCYSLWQRKRTEVFCEQCGVCIIKKTCAIHKHNFCSMKCKFEWFVGKNSINWQNGKSFEPYGIKFDKKFKEGIRNRDSHRCLGCNKSEKELNEKLCVHHVDYNKKHNEPKNMASLCKKCHSKTNFDREEHKQFLQLKLSKLYNYKY